MTPSPKTASIPPEAAPAVQGLRARRRVDGVLLLDKPVGLSSNAALQRTKRLYRAEKAGHTGTLDPLASGLLPICFGEATKFAQALLDADKRYLATVRLGASTSTGDADGEIVARHPVTASRADIDAVLPRFLGRVAQVPPRHAALKHRGRKYYEYARKGVEIPRAAREIEIHELELLSWRPPDAELAIRCGKGTYIRVLAEDIGTALGCGAHLAALRRTATGGFVLDDGRGLEALERLLEPERDALLLPVDALVCGLQRLDLDGSDAIRFRQGQRLERHDVSDGLLRIYAGGIFAGVAAAAAGVLRPRRLMTDVPSIHR
jgi:tRNA pseudouridine55 synthase